MTMAMPWNVNGLVNAGVTAAMNDAGEAAGCEPLTWTIDASFSSLVLCGSAAGMYPDDEIPAVLAGWRDLLGMTVVDPIVPGTRRLTAEFPAVTVAVWGVIDGVKYHTHAADVVDAVPGGAGGDLADHLGAAEAVRMPEDAGVR